MNEFKLNNDLIIPCIGFGTYPQKEELNQSLAYAISNGCKLIDTSDNYHNEEFVGKLTDHGKINEDVLVISKFSEPTMSDEIEKCFLESKKKLGGKLDIYLLHWPYPFLWKKQWRAMEKLYTSGQCRAIGVCNFEKKHLQRLLKFCNVKPMINQFERHPIFQQRETYEFCLLNDIQVMCYSPLARNDKDLFENTVLKRIAQKYKKDIGQIILRWDIERKCIPIPSSKSEKHIHDNFDLFDFEITKEELSLIDDLEQNKRIRFDPDKRFSLTEKFKMAICSILMTIGIPLKIFRK